MIRYYVSLVFLWSWPMLLQAQQQNTHSADTSSAGYKIGYTVGEWLPFLILIVLVLMVMFRARKLSKE